MPTPQQTTAALIRHAVNQKHKDGLPRSETRLWAGLEEKFTSGDGEVELSLEQFTFIRDAVQAHHLAGAVGSAGGHVDGRH